MQLVTPKKGSIAFLFILVVLLFSCTDGNGSPSDQRVEVTFDPLGGSEVPSVRIDPGETVPRPESSRPGYALDGWYTGADDGSSYDKAWSFGSDTVDSDLTLYAKWTPIRYDITYELDGGTNGDNPSDYTIEMDTIALADPTRTGYDFAGWFDNEECTGDPVTSIERGSHGDLTLYAKWRPIEYAVTYYVATGYHPINGIDLLPEETLSRFGIGHSQSSALTSEGRLFTWGYNEYGQIGDGTTEHRSTPVEITEHFDLDEGEAIASMDLGLRHSAVLTFEGRLFTWGNNDSGQLGDGSNDHRAVPVDITERFNLNGGEAIVSVELGGLHSAALTSEGRLFTWGDNFVGKLGDGTTENRSTPVDITDLFDLDREETIERASLGSGHSAALTSEGRLFTWGSNVNGQAGGEATGDRLTPSEITDLFDLYDDETIETISLAGFHSAALTSKGRLFTWGNNGAGQLGDGTTDDRSTPVDITGHFDSDSGETIVSMDLGDFGNSAALTSKGRLFVWGDNRFGQIGDGTTTDRDTPVGITPNVDLDQGETIETVAMGGIHTAALTSSGRLFTWGRNEFGQLGDGSTTDRSTPRYSGSGYHFVADSFQSYRYRSTITPYTPTKEGYAFDGWYIDPGLAQDYTWGTMPAEDLDLYGIWVKE
ncbi:MAG: InlB B-repeat-containing protein [Acholeplasmataceae bacterium]